jgi:hypothetical protein
MTDVELEEARDRRHAELVKALQRVSDELRIASFRPHFPGFR